MKFGFEAYPWQTAARDYIGRLDHVIDIATHCGIQGIETEVCMLGRYAQDPGRLMDDLASRGVSLVAICYVEDWRGSGEIDEEAARADSLIDYLRQFPGALLRLCPRSGKDRTDLAERQQNAIRCMNDVAGRAADERYRLTIDSFDSLRGLQFKKMLKDAGISLTVDVESLHPTKAGWDRKLIKGGSRDDDLFWTHTIESARAVGSSFFL